MAPSYMSDMFRKVSEPHCRVTRASDSQGLYLPGGKNQERYTDSFACTGAMEQYDT